MPKNKLLQSHFEVIFVGSFTNSQCQWNSNYADFSFFFFFAMISHIELLLPNDTSRNRNSEMWYTFSVCSISISSQFTETILSYIDKYNYSQETHFNTMSNQQHIGKNTALNSKAWQFHCRTSTTNIVSVSIANLPYLYVYFKQYFLRWNTYSRSDEGIFNVLI